MSKFFIDHPVFAWVIAIIIMLAGILAIRKLPVEQYPNIAPPSVTVRATFPGGSAQVVETSVTQVIEQNLTGLDNLRYISSHSDASGTAQIELTFEPGTNPDIAQVQVQNKVQGVISLLPSVVQQIGIQVTKTNNNFLLIVGFYSKDGKTSQAALGDLLSSKFKDPIARVSGVGNVRVFGQPYAMRIWLDPHKLLSYHLTTIDVQNAIKAQNTDVSAGQIGALPAVPGQQLNATIRVQTRLRTVEQFQNIIIKINPDGSQVRLKDVARVALGSEQYGTIARYKRNPAVGLAVTLASGANALDTEKAVKEKIKALEQYLPKSVGVIYPYDTTPFIRLSINQVVETLLEAVVLVFLVMLLFLQNLRATIIPGIAVPVVLLGTFAVLLACGFSINVLTMFAMVLAIGLLVDDAIVVVENVERIMHEKKVSAREATRESMEQITNALIGITLVLSSVFVPMAFFSGSAGAIYRQFSITIVSAMILSVLVALILSPSLCAKFLKPHDEKKQDLQLFFSGFNRGFDATRSLYLSTAKWLAQHKWIAILIYSAIVATLVALFLRLPSSFLPSEDQGTMFIMMMAPPGATAERTLKSVMKVEDYFLNNESDNIQDFFTVTGFSFAGVGQNMALGFVGLKDWVDRMGQGQSVFALAGRSMAALSQLRDVIAFAFYPPPIRDLGNASGFNMQLLDLDGVGHEGLMKARDQLLQAVRSNPKLVGVRVNGLEDVPQFKVNIDQERAVAMGLSLSDINQTLQSAWGSHYINDFIDKGRIKKVYMQADAPYRMLPKDINDWYVRNNQGKMVSFDSFSTFDWTYGSPKLDRFDGFASVNIQGSAAPGVSSGEAMSIMQKLVSKLPKGIGSAWIGLSYEEQITGAQAPALYALSILIIFLSLAALYESWSIPFSVLFVMPLGVIGAVVATLFKGASNDIYFQVGLLTTLGLTAKNAILIVEFAKSLYEDGHDLVEATLMAAKLRYRPIIMTSMAFILGVTPLALADGAGSAAQNAIGIGVIGGMLAAMIFAILFVPLFYILIQGSSKK